MAGARPRPNSLKCFTSHSTQGLRDCGKTLNLSHSPQGFSLGISALLKRGNHFNGLPGGDHLGNEKTGKPLEWFPDLLSSVIPRLKAWGE